MIYIDTYRTYFYIFIFFIPLLTQPRCCTFLLLIIIFLFGFYGSIPDYCFNILGIVLKWTLIIRIWLNINIIVSFSLTCSKIVFLYLWKIFEFLNLIFLFLGCLLSLYAHFLIIFQWMDKVSAKQRKSTFVNRACILIFITVFIFSDIVESRPLLGISDYILVVNECHVWLIVTCF